MKQFLVLVAILIILTSCVSPSLPESVISEPVVQKDHTSLPANPTVIEIPTLLPTQIPTNIAIETKPATVAINPTPETPAATQIPTTSPASLGPDNFPEGINPLTGLLVKESSLLTLPPALVSISNFPVRARPQAGLSFSPYVYEIYIGEGMTRFLAMFYGNFPSKSSTTSSSNSQTSSDSANIGPVRSGRLPYESLRNLYNGFLVMASASPEVGAQLKSTNNVYNPTDDDINGAMVDVTRLQSIAEASANSKNKVNLTGNAFNPIAPAGGNPAITLQIFYSFLNQVKWTFNPTSGAYLRFQDKADGTGNFYPATDRIDEKQLAFNNVIVLFARHVVLNSQRTLIDIDLLYTSGKAYLFRDGQVYPMKWTTANGDYEKTTGRLRPIRFLDDNGSPMQLKPGNTWVEVVDLSTLIENPQSGIWKARFFNP
jgi:hypothetical protein